ncbi:unnamed protein product [Paramecium pentaurelia]|uniref:Transmembrane protein n=1 Tax=Paramecium pentaurelia TaxID=43138 RepID=A0A8S1TMQ6_9CILI|nr:unnamed protein product [Paramecium pentaurelia]
MTLLQQKEIYVRKLSGMLRLLSGQNQILHKYLNAIDFLRKIKLNTIKLQENLQFNTKNLFRVSMTFIFSSIFWNLFTQPFFNILQFQRLRSLDQMQYQKQQLIHGEQEIRKTYFWIKQRIQRIKILIQDMLQYEEWDGKHITNLFNDILEPIKNRFLKKLCVCKLYSNSLEK